MLAQELPGLRRHDADVQIVRLDGDALPDAVGEAP